MQISNVQERAEALDQARRVRVLRPEEVDVDKAYALALLRLELLVEHRHTLLGAVFAAEPDRASANQIGRAHV